MRFASMAILAVVVAGSVAMNMDGLQSATFNLQHLPASTTPVPPYLSPPYTPAIRDTTHTPRPVTSHTPATHDTIHTPVPPYIPETHDTTHTHTPATHDTTHTPVPSYIPETHDAIHTHTPVKSNTPTASPHLPFLTPTRSNVSARVSARDSSPAIRTFNRIYGVLEVARTPALTLEPAFLTWLLHHTGLPNLYFIYDGPDRASAAMKALGGEGGGVEGEGRGGGGEGERSVGEEGRKSGRKGDPPMVLLRYNGEDMSLLQKTLSTPSFPPTFIILCSKDCITHIFNTVREGRLERRAAWWVIISQEDLSQHLTQLIQEGSQVTLAVQHSSTEYQLLSSRIDSQEKIYFSPTGTWALGRNGASSAPLVRLTSFLTPHLLDLYANFGGRQLKVTTNDNWPFFGLTTLPDGEGRLVPDAGIDVRIMNTLGDYLNFTYVVSKPPDGQWGGPLANGTITGLIGQVAYRKVHVAICEITITGSREAVVDFSTPYYLESATLISRAPKLKSRTVAVFSPFTLQVWLCIALSTLTVGPVAALFTWLAPPDLTTYTRTRQVKVNERRAVQEYAFNLFRNLVVQGNLISPRAGHLKMLFIGWYLFCFYVCALYSGSLTAVFAAPAYEKPVDSLWDLPNVAQQGFTIGVMKDTSLEYIYKEATSGVYKAVWQLFDPDKSFVSHPDQGFDRITREKYVFINPQLNSELRAIQRGRHRFYFAKQTFYPQAYGLASFNGAPFLPKFNQMLSRMKESGLIYQFRDLELGRAKSTAVVPTLSTSVRDKRKPSAITLDHLQAAFFVLFLGFVLSMVALIGEGIWTIRGASSVTNMMD